MPIVGRSGFSKARFDLVQHDKALINRHLFSGRASKHPRVYPATIPITRKEPVQRSAYEGDERRTALQETLETTLQEGCSEWRRAT